MGSHSIVVFSLLLVSSILGISTIQNSFGEVIATSTGFEGSSILELKNSRASTQSIDSVRIWLGEDNEFKSFKTEQGWLGKKQLNGVIEFTSQSQVNPGESVKFGVKTMQNNPIINWKAVDSDGNVISSASTKSIENELEGKKPELNKPKIIAIKDESTFRFIPEKPSSDSDFRVVGENFVPNQSLDFYISDTLNQVITSDKDGKILFTARTPVIENDERTEFALRDTGGNEKLLSIRVPQLENREIANIVKLSIYNTPQQVKLGDTTKFEGMATPNLTLTFTARYDNGDIINVETIQVGFDGKWSYNFLYSPQYDLGNIAVEVTDGKNTVLRNTEVITAKVINVNSELTRYEGGETVQFLGTGIPNKEMSVVLEDSIGAEVFSRIISVGDSGNVNFSVDIPRGSVEGTYILMLFQGDEEGITTFGIGQEPSSILLVRPVKLNFNVSETIEISIQGDPNAQVGVILIDSADREILVESINLGPDGQEMYKINSDELTVGSYTLTAKRGTGGTDSARFTLGLTTGSGSIDVQTTKDEYRPGEQVLILGKTDTENVLLDLTIYDSEGITIKKITTFSNQNGVFKMDNFRIPVDGKQGEWSVVAKSGSNFNEASFSVIEQERRLQVFLDKTSYNVNEYVVISGLGGNAGSTITIKIFNSEQVEIIELNVTATGSGEFSTLWLIPADLLTSEYELTVDDGKSNDTIKFTIN